MATPQGLPASPGWGPPCYHKKAGSGLRWVAGVPCLSPLASLQQLQPRGAPWVLLRTPVLGHPGTCCSFLGSDEKLWQPGECQGPSLRAGGASLCCAPLGLSLRVGPGVRGPGLQGLVDTAQIRPQSSSMAWTQSHLLQTLSRRKCLCKHRAYLAHSRWSVIGTFALASGLVREASTPMPL